MGFFKKQKKRTDHTFTKIKIPFFRRRQGRILIKLFIILFVVGSALTLYLLRSGSKIFENGLSGFSLIKTLVGGDEQLEGQKDDRINILLTGMGGANHPGGLLTDSIMVLSIKPQAKKAAIISVPRDLLVPIKGHDEDKVNTAFVDGYNDYIQKNCKKRTSQCVKDAMSAASTLTGETISKVVGVPIHYYLNVEFNGFEKIIDQLGGIDVYVDKAIYDPSFPSEDMVGYTTFRISAGQQHLDGKTALKYARSRETTSDFDRSARQQKILLAVKEKADKTNFFANPTKVLSIFNTLADSFHTNFTPSEIKTLVDSLKDFNKSDLTTKVLNNSKDGLLTDYNDGTYYLKPRAGNFDEIQSFVKNIFEAKKDVGLEVSNGGKLSTSQFDKVVSSLKDDSLANFTIIGTSTSKTEVSQTTIYDHTDGSKDDILEYLKEKYDAQVSRKANTTSAKTDFTIILGKNYLTK